MSRGRDWSVLRPCDPVGGDPDELARVARGCALTAEALQDGAAALRDVACRSTAWESAAGEAFRARTGDAVRALELARPRFARTADAVAQYARAVQLAQDDADEVLARAWRALDEREAADRAWRVADDPLHQRLWAERAEQAQRRLDAADRALAEVEAAWWQAGTRAAAELEEATTADGLDDGWDVLGAVAVVADVAGRLSTFLGGAALACLLLPGLQWAVPPLAGLSTFAGLISVAAFHELWVRDQVSGRRFATEAGWALVGILTGGTGRLLRGGAAPVAPSVRAARATQAGAVLERVDTAAPTLRTLGSDGAGPTAAPAPAALPPRCPSRTDAERRDRRRGVGSIP